MNRTLASRERSLNSVRMHKPLPNLKKSFLLLLLAQALLSAVNAQTISGTIKDQVGTAMRGVSVIIKNTSIGTTTNSTGQYTINVRGTSDVLVFSYVGYDAQEI